MEVARRVGLDAIALNAALEENNYLPRLQETTRKAKEKWITSAPTFTIEGYGNISGAQPIDTFRSALREAEKALKNIPSMTVS